ncbi:hypothetical protein MMC25_005994 [Agyrium rufum]|nr:hypothetical protein [Agyrium rufum]
MADDDSAYTDFLDKANQDTGASAQVSSASGGGKSAGIRTVDTDVPAHLKGVDVYYVSDADEPFEPVSLKWEGDSVPGEDEFKSLLNAKGDISTLSTKEFDPKGEYKDVLGAVEKVGSDGEVKIYRIETSGTRVEYWVVGYDKKGGRVVGLRAKAVES